MLCPFCQEIKTEVLFEANNTHGSNKLSDEKIVILKCPSCSLLFPRIRWKKEYYDLYYPVNYYGLPPQKSNILEKIYKKINYSLTIYLITKYLHQKRNYSLLDFGCGRGSLLNNLPNNIKKYGLEVSKDARKYINKNYQNITVYGDLNTPELKNNMFDMVSLWHVLEHLENPEYVLNKIRSITKKKGFIILETPNSASWILSLAKSKWFHLDAPRHLRIFNLQNIRKLAKKLNLEIIEIKYPFWEYPLDIFRSFYELLKTKYHLINIILILVIFPISIIIKILSTFNPQKAEIIRLVLRKK